MRVGAGHRAHRDDGAARRLERWIRRFREEPRGPGVHGEYTVPVVDRVADQRAGAVDTRVAHQPVEPAEPADRFAHDPRGRVGGAHIAMERERLGLVASQLVQQAVEARRRADVDCRDLGFLPLGPRIARQA